MRWTHLRYRRHRARSRQTPPGHPRRPWLEHPTHLVYRLVARSRPTNQKTPRYPRSPKSKQLENRRVSPVVATGRNIESSLDLKFILPICIAMRPGRIILQSAFLAFDLSPDFRERLRPLCGESHRPSAEHISRMARTRGARHGHVSAFSPGELPYGIPARHLTARADSLLRY